MVEGSSLSEVVSAAAKDSTAVRGRMTENFIFDVEENKIDIGLWISWGEGQGVGDFTGESYRALNSLNARTGFQGYIL